MCVRGCRQSSHNQKNLKLSLFLSVCFTSMKQLNQKQIIKATFYFFLNRPTCEWILTKISMCYIFIFILITTTFCVPHAILLSDQFMSEIIRILPAIEDFLSTNVIIFGTWTKYLAFLIGFWFCLIPMFVFWFFPFLWVTFWTILTFGSGSELIYLRKVSLFAVLNFFCPWDKEATLVRQCYLQNILIKLAPIDVVNIIKHYIE